MNRLTLERAKAILRLDLVSESNAVERRELEQQIHLIERLESVYAASELAEIAELARDGVREDS